MTFNEIIAYLLARYNEDPLSEVKTDPKARKAWTNRMTTAWEIIQENAAPDVYEQARDFFNMMDFCRYRAAED